MADSFGRSSNISRDSLAEGMLSGTSHVIKKKDAGEKSKAYDDLREGVEKLASKIDGKSLETMMKTANDWKDEVVNLRKEIAELRKTSETIKDDRSFEKKALSSIDRTMSALFKEAKSQNTLWMGISKFGNKAKNDLSRILYDTIVKNCCQKASDDVVGKSSPTTRDINTMRTRDDVVLTESSSSPTTTTPVGTTKDSTGFTTAATLGAYALEGWGNLVGEFTRALDVDFGNIFKGMISDENTFRENIRMLVYEVEGFSVMNRKLETSYMDVDNAVRMTGVTRTKYQQIWYENLQRGLAFESKAERAAFEEAMKNAKTLEKRQKIEERYERLRFKRHKGVTVTALHTAQQLSMNSDNIAKLFMDWHLQLGMSSLQLSNIGRQMQQIARTSGVTGQNLENAVQQAQKLIEELRSAGTLNPAAMTNIMELTTHMEKYGVSGAAANMMTALSSGKNYMNADPATQSMMMRFADGNADLMDKIFQGSVMRNKTDIRNFGEGMGAEVQRYLAGMGVTDDFIRNQLGMEGGFDASKLTTIMDRMIKRGYGDIVGMINMQAPHVFGGMGMGDLERTYNSIIDASRKYEENISELEKELARAGGLKGGVGTDQAKEIQKRIDEYKEGSIIDAFTMLQQEVKDSGKTAAESMGAWREELKSQYGEEFAGKFEGAGMAEQAGKLFESMGKKAADVGLNLTKEFDEQGFGLAEMKEKLQTGDEAALMALNNVYQRINKKTKDTQDPIVNLKKSIDELNESVRSLTAAIMSSMTGWMFAMALSSGLLAKLGSKFLLFKTALKKFGGNVQAKGLWGTVKPWLTNLWKNMEPWVTALFKGIKDRLISLVNWVKKLSIFQKVSKWIGSFTGWVKELSIVQKISKWIGTFVSWIRKLSIFQKVIGWIRTGFTFLKNLRWIGPIFKGLAAVGAFIATGGLPAIIAAIVAGVGILFSLFEGGKETLMELISPLSTIWTMVKELFGGLWDVVAGFFTLDASRLGEGLMTFVMAIPKALYKLGEYILYTLPKIILTGLWNAFKYAFIKLPKFVWEVAKKSISWLSKNSDRIIDEAMTFFKEVFVGFGVLFQEAAVAVFDWFKNVWNNLAPTAYEIGSMFLKGLKAVFVDFPTWLLTKITETIIKVGEFLYETIKSVLSTLVDWVLGMLPSWEGVKDTGKAVWEGAKDTGKAVLHYINPLNWFEEGARKIEQPGVGVLHEGEMVIPKNIIDQIKAVGSGRMQPRDIAPFASAVNLGLFSKKDNIDEAMSMIDLNNVINNVSESETDTSPYVSSNIMSYDETDSPFVSPAMFSKDDAETYLENKKYSTSSGQLAMIPSMDSISEYLLGSQSEKLDRMIEELVSIKNNTANLGASDNVGEQIITNLSSSRSLLKRTAKETKVGDWNLQPGAYSQANVISDGRK